MRVLGSRAAEIVPHAAQNALVFRAIVLRQCADEIFAGAARHLRPRAQCPANETADGGRRIYRQEPEGAESSNTGRGLRRRGEYRDRAPGAKPAMTTPASKELVPS